MYVALVWCDLSRASIILTDTIHRLACRYTQLNNQPPTPYTTPHKVRYNTGAAGAVLSKTSPEGGSLTIGVIAAPAPAPAAPAAPPKPTKPRVGGVPVPYQPSRKHAVQPVKWESKEGQLWANGRAFKLKGVNWFGCETNTRYPHGLWKVR